jgi:hypothetical protein
MSVYLLCHHIADEATSIDLPQGVDTGFYANDAIIGARSCIHKRSGTGTYDLVEYRGSAYPAGTPNLTADFLVQVRADLQFRNSVSSSAANLWRHNGTTWVLHSTATPSTSDLTGPKSQDYVRLFSSGTGTGWEYQQTYSAATGGAHGAIYLGRQFSFNVPPTGPVYWEEFPEPVSLTPMRATRPFECEAKFNITWQRITAAKLTAFKALPKLYYWPFFIYDDAADFIPWKLEHVILGSWSAQLRYVDTWDLTLECYRLRHYP